MASSGGLGRFSLQPESWRPQVSVSLGLFPLYRFLGSVKLDSHKSATLLASPGGSDEADHIKGGFEK